MIEGNIAHLPARGAKMPSSLEDLLTALASYGSPRVTQIKKGWYCCVEMRVSSVGVDFKIASEFNHQTPTAAARECYERVVKTVSEIG